MLPLALLVDGDGALEDDLLAVALLGEADPLGAEELAGVPGGPLDAAGLALAGAALVVEPAAVPLGVQLHVLVLRHGSRVL